MLLFGNPSMAGLAHIGLRNTTADNALPHSGSGRLVSLDVMRGLTVAAMILVTDPGTYSAVYWPLLHAAWQGATPTDMIFPAFLFMVGISIVFSTNARLARGNTRAQLAGHAVRRAAVLIMLGLAVNGFPSYNLHYLRLPGILQRIALCYLAAALLYLFLGRFDRDGASAARETPRTVSAILACIIAAILIGYWALLRFVSVPGFGPARYDSLGYLGAYIDRAVFTTPHLWAYGLTPGYGVTYDSEGILSTLPAIANTLLGVLTGLWLRTNSRPRTKLLALLLVGTVLCAACWLCAPLMPINKRIWTSTFALLSGGVSLVALGFFYWLVDMRRSRWWTTPALIFGTNAILGFVLSSVITSLCVLRLRIGGSMLSLHEAAYRYLFAPWLAPRNASLAYALIIVLLNMAMIYPLYRKRIFLRV